MTSLAQTPPAASPSSSSLQSRLLFWIFLGGGLLFVVQILVPHMRAYFVADDYSFLVEDSEKPWYFSGDLLYRPFRNLLAHLLPRLIGLSPVPYRVLVAIVILSSLALFYLLLRQFGVSKEGSLAGILIAAFYPRHATVYYFWAASQDAFMTLALLAAFLWWIKYRASDKWVYYLLALGSFAVALGFKEPAACFPGILFGWDVLRLDGSWRNALRPSFWRPYIGFVIVLAAFGAFVVWYPEGRFHQPDRYGIYGFFGIGRGVFAWIRTWINLLLPFATPISLHGLTIVDLLSLGLIGAFVFIAAKWLRLGAAILLCGAAIALLNVPSSFFASRSPGDQYLYLPSFVLAGFLGYLIGVLLGRPALLKAAAVTGLIVYILFGAIYLRDRQIESKAACDLSHRIIGLIREAVPPESVQELTLIGPPQSLGNASVFNNGMLGALEHVGYSRDLHVLLTHVDGVPPGSGQLLMERTLACKTSATSGASRTLLVNSESAVELDPACASSIVAADRTARPWAWSAYPADH